jgi:hypothetical protein
VGASFLTFSLKWREGRRNGDCSASSGELDQPDFSTSRGRDEGGEIMRSHRLILVAALALLVAPVWAAEVASNGGFEMAGGGGATDSDKWEEFGAGPAGTLSERDSTNPNTGSWAHRLVAVGDDTAGASAGINQNSVVAGLPSLEGGTTVSASLQHNTDLGPGGVGFVTLRVLNADGAIVADSGLVAMPATGGSYDSLSTPSINVPAFGPAPNDVYAAFLEISVGAGGFAGSTAESFIDDASINGTLVDEPPPPVPTTSEWGLITIALLLLAALAGVSVVRRQRLGA